MCSTSMNPQFADERIKTQREEVTHPELHSLQAPELGLKPSHSGSKSLLLTKMQCHLTLIFKRT